MPVDKIPSAGIDAGGVAPSNLSTGAPSWTTSGNLILQGGNSSANGIGVTFPATQSASTDANTLDDYEEGTFTLTLISSGYTVSTNAGIYIKIGRTVTIQYSASFTAVGAGNSNVVFSGLPFTSFNYQSATCQVGVCRENTATGAIYPVNVQSGGTNLEINSMDGVGTGQQRTIRANEIYSCTMTYFTS